MSEFKFATDSESGVISAASFEAACRQLDAMVQDSDGGVGWVEDADGFRYETEGQDLVEDIGGGYHEAADGTVIADGQAADDAASR